ncbi:MAG: hypothetical protein L0Y43_10780, partial [Methylococcaceae bacterium]|nr:hypothetical protein [Methylococcaceae bacterium]
IMPQKPRPVSLKSAIYDQIARIGQATASPSRLELLDLLSQGPRTVEVLRREDDGIVVSGGLDAGDAVLVGGVELPVEGMRVTLNTRDPDGAAMAPAQTASQ